MRTRCGPPRSRPRSTPNLRAMLERLWRTGEIFLERPDIADEFRNVVHYLTRVFPQVVPRLDGRLRAAWDAAGFDPGLLDDAALPQLRFGTWVGGDRDGHPFVTADVTERSLHSLRERAVVAARRRARRARRPPQPVRPHRPGAESSSPRGSMPRRPRSVRPVRVAVERNPDEPWRQAINLIRCPASPAAPRDAGSRRVAGIAMPTSWWTTCGGEPAAGRDRGRAAWRATTSTR